MIPAGKAKDAHQKDMANEELLLPILTAFAQCANSVHASRNARCFQHVCTVSPTNSSSPVPTIVNKLEVSNFFQALR